MAVSGTSSALTTTNSYINYKISIVENSTSTSGNTSNVTVTVNFYRTNTGYTTYGSGTVYCTIDGTTYSASVTSSQKITSSGIDLFSKTLTISHDSNGAKTLTVSAYISHSQFSSSSQSYSLALTTIARASSITSAAAVTLGNACSVVWTPLNSGYAYKLKFAVGSYSATTGYISPATTSAYTYTGYTMATATWAPYITTSTTATCTVTLYTYTSSSSSTSIGSASKTFTVTVPASCKPSVTISCAEGNSAVTLGVYVQSKSKVTVTSTGTTSYGAAIKSYTVKVGSTSYSGSSVTSNTLTSSGSVTVSCTVTDARGRTDTASTTITVYPYSAPSISKFTVVRCDSSGTADTDGEYALVTYTYSISSCNSKNTASMAIKSKLTSASSYTSKKTSTATSASAATAILSTYSTESSYNFQMSVTDAFSTTTKTVLLSTAAVIMDIIASGDGVAFGKVASLSEYVDFGWKTNHENHAYFANAKTIYGYDTSGKAYSALIPKTSSDNTSLGYGNYTNADGNTNLYGNDVLIYSAAASNSNFRPYLRAGDSNTITFYTAGYVTSSTSQVLFLIPLARYILGSPTVTLTSGNGFILRQDNAYTHGSAASTYVTPSSYSASIIAGMGIRVTATFSTTTNAINNAPIGIYWNGTITFS